MVTPVKLWSGLVMKIGSAAIATIALALVVSVGPRAVAPQMAPATSKTPVAAASLTRIATHGWERYPSEGFLSPAKDLCGFAFRSTTVFDRVFSRVAQTFDDGTPKVEQFTGPLVVQLRNERSHEKVERDLSGRAVVRHHLDGSYDFKSWGPVAVGFRDGDTLPRGYYVLSGHHVVRFDPDGRRTVVVDRGKEENLCLVLGGRSR